ncbi:MAG: PEP/pyruvate-binding domain-containing protein [Candidatus Paceibacterota bacterium]|jgi:pyruvate,water dikinase
MELIKTFNEITKSDTAIAGGKGASLGEMTQTGIPVPPGFVILSDAFERFLEKTDLNVEIDSILHSVDHREMHTIENASEKIKALILNAEIPVDISDEIQKFFKKLGTTYVAVRSSATAEDSASAAWAGQLETYLNTTDKTLLENVKKCWASLFTPRAIFYRFEKELHKQKISVAVVIQKMIESEKSGIAFSTHPITQDKNQIVVEAGFGLGEAIVSGQITPDSYVVEKEPRNVLDVNIEKQERGLFRSNLGGNEWKEIKEAKSASQVLSKEQILELVKIIIKIENHYEFPCDIEWAFADETFYIVQSRPITTLNYDIGKQSPKYLYDGDRWLLAEDIPDIDFQFSQIWLSSFVNDLEKTIGINYKKVISVYNNGYNLKFYYGDKDSEAVSSTILRKIIDENFGMEINKNIRRVADELFEISKRIDPKFLQGLSNKEFSDFYTKLDDIHTEFYSWCWLPNAVDMFHTHFTNYLKTLLAKHSKSEEEINTALVALSFSEEKSFIQDELESLLKIAIYKKDNPNDKATIEKMLAEHHAEYFFLKHLWIGKDGISTIEEYRQAVDKMLTEHDPKEVLESEHKKWADDKKLRDNYEKKLNLSAKEKELFRTYAEFGFTKAYRRRIQLYWAYKMDFIFEELSKRLGVSFIESRFLMPNEVEEGLKNGLSSEIKKIATERTKHCVYYTEKGLDIIAIGDDCKQFESTIVEEINGEMDEFKGQVACLGKVQGMVKIVNSTSDMHKVNDGDILVSIATNPDILPAMKKAIAFVTEQGGITSHAAIVAREMRKPCIIGTKIATKVLKDGDMIEVDANNGIVKILK